VVDHAIGLLREREEAIRRILSCPVPLPELPEFLVRGEEGEVSFRGRRIGLHLVLERYFAGDDVVQIQDRFSSLSLAEVEAVASLAERHRAALQAYVDQRQQIQRLLMDDAHRGPSRDELRARWEEKLAPRGRPPA
jgi:uncharacterized protein (DUF433 family)